jgi:hypothetical protein
MFSLKYEEDVQYSTGGDNYCSVLHLALGKEMTRMPGGDSDCSPWPLLVGWGGRMGITGQVGTATDLAQLIPSLGGFMVLGVMWGTCVCSQGLGSIRHLDRAGMWLKWIRSNYSNIQIAWAGRGVRKLLPFYFHSSFHSSFDLGPA